MTTRFYFFSLFCFVFLNFEKPSVRQLVQKSKDYALFFAVNKYQSPKITPLQNPISDAKRIAQELQNSYGFQTEVVENPTYEIIEKKLEEYNRNFNTGKFDTTGQLLIFFSGHGAVQLKNGYFLPSDVNPADLKRSAFNYKIWRDDIDAIDCKHILVAIDACYSGSFDPKFGMRDGLWVTRAGELTEGQRLIAEHDKHKTRLFFTSGESDQPTPDKSDFAKKFLASLLTKGYDDGVLTSSEMFSNHLEKAAPRPRTGEFGGDEAGSSFVFVVENTKNTEGVSNVQRETGVWQNAKTQNTLYAYQEYLRLYPNGDFVSQARRAVTDFGKQEELATWATAKAQNTKESYQNFLNRYPNSLYAETAREWLGNFDIKTTPSLSRHSFEPEMVPVQGGTFQMGDVIGDNEYDFEKPVHPVTLSSFQMGKYEVTQAQWVAVMGNNPSRFKGDNLPVEQVSWEEVQEYLKKLNQRAVKKYRLPTEAEWEYAARSGGKKVRFGNGKDVANPSEINFDGSKDYKKSYSAEGVYRGKTTNVGSFSPNSLGLYDMSGNVCEWCSDWYSDYSSINVSNPTGTTTGSNRVNRGGGWYSEPRLCRVTLRNNSSPSLRLSYLGFRVACASQ